ncbi:glycosyltransferase family 4 protein [Cryptosporangium phraense]|uniref:Glycosyltransferase family 4 protein n=1 Tax=Cryptosporangium phraense TaxID=2593070 RepID=A0A545AJ38_9ACTN|nr:glycosyltransferase family 4 protein [Cryptosporangium phraense]TQS41328.1 glycosyltransferase family 4 protein [Cryptosporangium phraense]
MVRVLTLVDAFRLGGAETLIAQLGRVAGTAGFEMDVLSLSPPSEEHSKLEPLLRESGLTPRYLGVRRTLDPRAPRLLANAIKESGADVVHAHLEMAMTLAVPAAKMAGRNAICTWHHVHRALPGRAAWREKLALEVSSRAYRTIFVSEASRKSFADKYRPGKPLPKNWVVVHNGVDLAHFSPGPALMPPEFGVTGRPVVTVLAAQRDFKGITHAVDAWPKVRAARPEARMLLVGSGDEHENLRCQVAEAGLQDDIIFTGARSDVVDILRASDVVLLPSTYGENLPTVLIEAAGCARPVVASRIGGIPDIVEDGVTGLLTPPGDPSAIADALISLLDDPSRRAAMGVTARSHVEQHFDAVNWARQLKSLYEEASVVGVPA